MAQLKDIGEDALISRLLSGLSTGGDVLVGPGDDCAVIDVGDNDRYQLLKTDCIVEGVHYLPNTPAEQVGWKAIARVISDFAAMGGYPSQLLVTIVLAAEQAVEYVEKLYAGMQRCAEQFNAVISGGETSSMPLGSAVISVSGTGWVNKRQLVTRSGGKPGDSILVTGKLGGSIQGKHLTFTPRVEEAKWLTQNFSLHAMMDLSDGLAKDLPRLATLSGCGFEVDEVSIPCNQDCSTEKALGDGEDYELLFMLSAEQSDLLLEQWYQAFPELKLTQIGQLTDSGISKIPLGKGWEHFRS